MQKPSKVRESQITVYRNDFEPNNTRIYITKISISLGLKHNLCNVLFLFPLMLTALRILPVFIGKQKGNKTMTFCSQLRSQLMTPQSYDTSGEWPVLSSEPNFIKLAAYINL